MRFNAFSLKNFGKFTGQEIAFPLRDRDFHVVVGPNEAGKSTLRAALLDLLFGIPKNSGHGFLHGTTEMRLGAQLARGAQQLHVERVKAQKNTLRNAQDEILPDDVLLPFLGSVDRDFYTQMFSLDHTRLVNGGQDMLTTSSDIGQLLFQSAAGLAHLGAAREALDAEAQSLWGRRRAGKHSYYQAEEALAAASASLKSSSMRAREFSSASMQMEALEKQVEQVRSEHLALIGERSMLERVRRVAPHLDRVDRLQEQLQALGSIPLLGENASAVVQSVQQVLARQELETQHRQSQLEQAHAALALLRFDEKVLQLREDIEALNDQRLRLAGHAETIAQKRTEIVLLETQESDLRRELDWSGLLPTHSQRRELVDLLAQKTQIQSALNADLLVLAGRQSTLSTARTRLEELGAADDSLALRLAVEQAQRLGDVQEQTARYAREIERCERALAAAQLGLGAWAMTIAQLEALVAPNRQEIARHLQESQDREIALRGLLRRQIELGASITALREKLSLTPMGAGVVSPEALALARGERDALWSTMRQSTEAMPTYADMFSVLLRDADLLADQRMMQLAAASQFQLEQAGLRTMEQDLHTIEREIFRERELQDKADRNWLAQAQACGLPSMPIGIVDNWLEAREKALYAHAQWQLAQEVKRDFTQRLSSVESALAEALQRELSPFGLAYAMARERLEMQLQHRGERLALHAQVSKESHAIEQVELKLAEHHRALAEWREQWGSAVSLLGQSANIDTKEVQRLLDLSGKLGEVIEARERLQQREVRVLESQLQQFDSATLALAEELDEPMAESSPNDIVLALMRRLRLSMEAQQERARQGSIADETAAALRDLALSAEQARARLLPLYALAGVKSIDPLVGLIAQSEEKRRLVDKIESATAQISDAADGFTLAQLREQTRWLQGQDLAVRSEQLHAQEQDLLPKIEQLAAQRENASIGLQAFAGQASAASAEAQRQEALSAMAQSAERYIAVYTASRMLSWSVDRFRQVQQGPMLLAASKVFSQLSNQSFSSLMVDFEVDPPELLGRRPSGERLKIAQMSEGTRDQLYLALRIAALQLHCSQTQALPFVADDLFINFDDERSLAGVQALGELSRHTQVIFLTHHSHLLPVIERVFPDGVNVVRF